MKYVDMAKAALAWVWGWAMWAWAKLKSVGNWVYDPPPHQIKWWALVVVGIVTVGMFFGSAMTSWFDRSVLGPLHTAMYPVAQPVEPVTLLPKGAVIPSAMPLKDAPKAAELPPLKVVVSPPTVAPKAPETKAPVRSYRAKKKPAVNYGAAY